MAMDGMLAAFVAKSLEEVIAEAVAPILGIESRWSATKLEGKLCQYVRSASKHIKFAEGQWKEQLLEYCGYIFESIMTPLGDRPWLNEVDFLPVCHKGAREVFPKALIADIPIEEFEEALLEAHDRAYEEQRFLSVLWTLTENMFPDVAIRKKVYGALDWARKQAVIELHRRHKDDEPIPDPDEFAQLWIRESLKYCPSVHMHLLARLFHTLIEAGVVLPLVLVYEDGPPPQGWVLVEQTIGCGPAPLPPQPSNSSSSSRGSNKRQRGKGGSKGDGAPNNQFNNNNNNGNSMNFNNNNMNQANNHNNSNRFGQGWQAQTSGVKRPRNAQFTPPGFEGPPMPMPVPMPPRRVPTAKPAITAPPPAEPRWSGPKDCNGHPKCQAPLCLGSSTDILMRQVVEDDPISDGTLYCKTCWDAMVLLDCGMVGIVVR